jgi:hypothetical protein
MGDSRNVREVVERVVRATLTANFAEMKDELVDKVCEHLEQMTPQAAAPAPPPGGASTDLLNAAMNSILDSSTQVDILGSLLDGASQFAERAALFVIRSGAATGWRAVGLEHNDGIKAVTLNLSFGLGSRAFHDRVPAAGAAAEFDAQFNSTYGAPAEGSVGLVLPLVIRDKVAALVYADGGMSLEGKLDPSALEALVHCAGLWLEVVGARKGGATTTETERHMERYAEPAAAAAAVGSDTDRHLSKYTEPAAEPAEEMRSAAFSEEPAAEPAPPVYAAAQPEPAPEPAFTSAAVATIAESAPAPEPPAMQTVAMPAPAFSGLSPEEEELHKKAKRFAKLLVDEIKLYNQAKLAEGRQNSDIYARLRDDIDKSRATYDKRYGATSAAGGNYFIQELVRILANDDESLLGSGFSG